MLGSAAGSVGRSLAGIGAAPGRSGPLSADLFDGQEAAIQRSARGMWRPSEHAEAEPAPREVMPEASPLDGDIRHASMATADATPCSTSGPTTPGSAMRRATPSGCEHLAPSDAPVPAATTLRRVGLTGLHEVLGGGGGAFQRKDSSRRMESLRTALSMILSEEGDTRRGREGKVLSHAPEPESGAEGTHSGGRRLLGRPGRHAHAADNTSRDDLASRPLTPTVPCSLAPLPAPAAPVTVTPPGVLPSELGAGGPTADTDNDEGWTDLVFTSGQGAFPSVSPSPLHSGTVASYSGAYKSGPYGSGDVPTAGLFTRSSNEQLRSSGSLTRPSSAGRPSSPMAQPGGDRGAAAAAWSTSAFTWTKALVQGRQRNSTGSQSLDHHRRFAAEDSFQWPRYSVDSKLKAAGICNVAPQIGREPASQSLSASHDSTSQRKHSAREPPLAAGPEPGSSKPSAAGARSRGGKAASGRRDSAYSRSIVPSDSELGMMPRLSPPMVPLSTLTGASWAGIEAESASQRSKGMQERTLSLIMSVDDDAADRPAPADADAALPGSLGGSHAGPGGTNGSLASLRSYATPTASNSGIRRAPPSGSPFFWARAVTGRFAALAAVCAYVFRLVCAFAVAAAALCTSAKAAAVALASAAFVKFARAISADPWPSGSFFHESPSCSRSGTLHGESSNGARLVGSRSGTLHGESPSRSDTPHLDLGPPQSRSGTLRGEPGTPTGTNSGRINLAIRYAAPPFLSRSRSCFERKQVFLSLQPVNSPLDPPILSHASRYCRSSETLDPAPSAAVPEAQGPGPAPLGESRLDSADPPIPLGPGAGTMGEEDPRGQAAAGGTPASELLSGSAEEHIVARDIEMRPLWLRFRRHKTESL